MTESEPESQSHTVTDDDIHRFAQVLGLGEAIRGRCSRVFLFQLYCCAFAQDLGDPVKIVAEINFLEGSRRSAGTKEAEPFEKQPLRGLWKKHYLIGGVRSVAMNTILAAGRKKKEFYRIAERQYTKNKANIPDELLSRNIANDVTNLYALRSASNKLTGNWIVFCPYDGRNYYLCLGTHEEGDDAIFSRIRNGCVAEFPFLSCVLQG